MLELSHPVLLVFLHYDGAIALADGIASELAVGV